MSRSLFSFLLALITLLINCNQKEEEPEIETELITYVRLIFSPYNNGAPSVFTAIDPDSAGPAELSPVGEILLNSNTTYDLFIELEDNETGEEVKVLPEEHMFFFGFNDALFFTPSGSGNIENSKNEILYKDFDTNGLPIGSITTWATDSLYEGSFRILLKHLPDGMKDSTTTADAGYTDLDITWKINQE